MTTLEKYLIGAVVFLVSSGAFAGWWTLHNRAEQKIGMVVCEKQDAAVVATAEVHNAAAETTQQADDKKAGDTLNAALTDPIGALPPIPASMQQPAAASCPSPVPHPRSAAGQGQPAVAVRTGPQAAVVQPDWKAIERSDVQSARDADAEVKYWKGLLIAQYKLCGGPPAP
jgi:hypothetical protein